MSTKNSVEDYSLDSVVKEIKQQLESLSVLPGCTDALPPILLKIPDVAKLLNVSTARAYALARMRILPTISLGRQKRVALSALIGMINGGGKSLPG